MENFEVLDKMQGALNREMRRTKAALCAARNNDQIRRLSMQLIRIAGELKAVEESIDSIFQ